MGGGQSLGHFDEYPAIQQSGGGRYFPNRLLERSFVPVEESLLGSLTLLRRT